MNHKLQLVIIVFLLLSASVAAQTRLKALLPTIRREMKGNFTEKYFQVNGTTGYTLLTKTLPKDSLPASFHTLLRQNANAEMGNASEADHYISNNGGVRTETFTLRYDSLNTKWQINLGDYVYIMFMENIPGAQSTENISIPLAKYLEDNYEKYVIARDSMVTLNLSFNDMETNTPTRQTAYNIPADKADAAKRNVRQWLRAHALNTEYSMITISNNAILVNYTQDENANFIDFQQRTDGSLDVNLSVNTEYKPITKKPMAKADNKVKGFYVETKPDNGFYNAWNLPLAKKSIPNELGGIFSLERRSDMTVMHIRHRLYSDNEECWLDSAMTAIVDEETQTHYMARGYNVRQIWGKNIRIKDMAGKTIAIDVYFPPLPTGVRKFSVWGLQSFFVPSEHIYYMKRDGDLYLNR